MTDRTYTPKQLSALSGVTVRTLHHYDQIGLLVPKRSKNGYRSYSHTDVERLQQILLYRSMGLELSEIGRMLESPDYEAATALRNHLHILIARKTQLDMLIDTVRKTVESLEGGSEMTDEERFEGLKRETIDQNERTYGAEARKRFGDKVVDEANAKLMRMGEDEWADIMELEEAIKRQLSAAMETKDASGPEATELVRMHARWLQAHWPDGVYSPETHRGMADGYLADQRFIAYYDEACGEGATQFLHDAIHACA